MDNKMIKSRLIFLNNRLNYIFLTLTDSALRLTATILGISSWMFPVVYIFRVMNDHNELSMSSVIFNLVLIPICWYTGIAVNRIRVYGKQAADKEVFVSDD